VVEAMGIAAGAANALLLWNEEVYGFTQTTGIINRYVFILRRNSVLGTIGEEIVGAGAAPCFRDE
jgi:hypothetical protein